MPIKAKMPKTIVFKVTSLVLISIVLQTVLIIGMLILAGF